jgi:hypothetical protein
MDLVYEQDQKWKHVSILAASSAPFFCIILLEMLDIAILLLQHNDWYHPALFFMLPVQGGLQNYLRDHGR